MITTILDISEEKFENLFRDERFYLPIRWDGKDFQKTLKALFNIYIAKVEAEFPKLKYKAKQNCKLINDAVAYYLAGFPADAYDPIEQLMKILASTPLRTAEDSFRRKLSQPENRDVDRSLFRVSPVDENIPYNRERVFHTPYNLRSKVSTTRYSIAGFPSLYLGTNLRLCCEEIQYDPNKGFAITSRFEPEFTFDSEYREPSIIELAVKPQDFFADAAFKNERSRRRFDPRQLTDQEIREAYILWYPLIAACSYIRANKKDPFAAEYIIPQILMQWMRRKMNATSCRLSGIRYFSCASERASDMGFNYVFPASGKQCKDKAYCPVLATSFRLTKPLYIHDFDNIEDCENKLRRDTDLQYI